MIPMLRYRTGKFLLRFLLIAALFSGCGGPQKKISNTLDRASEARQEGDVNQAVQLLSNLNEAFPGNADILEALGLAYEEEPDPFAAAIALQQAVEADPERTYLLKSVAENYAAVGDYNSAQAAYERYLEDFPQDGEATMALADLYREANQIETAVDAYLRGYDLLERPLRGEEAVVLGDLFFQLGNYPRAENFYQVALESGDLSELPALFGLLKINVTNTNWTVAERVVERLDEEYPGALDASELYTVREDIANWKEARKRFEEEQEANRLASRENVQNRLSTELSRPGERPPRPEASEEPTPEEDQETQTETSPEPNTTTTSNQDPSPEPPPEEDSEPSPGKLAVLEETQENILEFFQEEELPPAPPQTGPFADIERARQFRREGVYSEAVRLLWQVLGNNPSIAEAWHELSLAYFANNEAATAETASLEAMRLDPRNPEYMLHHLDVIRQSRGRSVIIRELRLAQQRFPNNPEILFELALGYEEVASDSRNAAYLYNQFLDRYPNHPLTSEVRTKLRRLGFNG